jgi:hypothetical protein
MSTRRRFKISLQTACGRRFWVHKAAAHASLEELCGLWETPDGVPHYVTTKPPRYDELRLKARNACLKLYESIHELNDKWMDLDVDLFFAPIITSQWSYVNHYLVGTTVKNCCIDLTEIENKYHPRSLYTWEEMNIARDIADMSRGIMTPEGLLSGDLYGFAEALYVVMHFLSIGYI